METVLKETQQTQSYLSLCSIMGRALPLLGFSVVIREGLLGVQPLVFEGHRLTHRPLTCVDDACIGNWSGTACWPREGSSWRGFGFPMKLSNLVCHFVLWNWVVPLFPGNRVQKPITSSYSPYCTSGFVLPVLLRHSDRFWKHHSSPRTLSCVFSAVLKNGAPEWVAHRSSFS